MDDRQGISIDLKVTEIRINAAMGIVHLQVNNNVPLQTEHNIIALGNVRNWIANKEKPQKKNYHNLSPHNLLQPQRSSHKLA
jgi:hypothetical protein